MKRIFTAIAILACITASGQSGKKIHRKAVVADTHNDVLSSAVLDGKDISTSLTEGHSDLPRWEKGGVDLQFFSVWTGEKSRNPQGFYYDANEQIDSLRNIISRNNSRMILATTYAEVKKGLRQKKLVSLIGVEGGHMIEGDLGKLSELHNRGMRYLTLTWNNSTEWASSAKDETENPEAVKGLSSFGKEVVKRMNELGVIVDLSHVGEKAFYDALAVTTRPVMLSHSSVWNICPVFRNVKDDQIKAVAANNGVICINFYSGFISKTYDERSEALGNKMRRPFIDSMLAIEPDSSKARAAWSRFYRSEMQKVRPTLSDVADHIDYIVNLVGVDHVGIGADYDGVGSVPVGLDDVSSYPALTAELRRRNYSKKSIRKVLGGNVLRVMKANFLQ